MKTNQEMLDLALQLATEDVDSMSDNEIAEYLDINVDEVNYLYVDDAISKRIEYYLNEWNNNGK